MREREPKVDARTAVIKRACDAMLEKGYETVTATSVIHNTVHSAYFLWLMEQWKTDEVLYKALLSEIQQAESKKRRWT